MNSYFLIGRNQSIFQQKRIAGLFFELVEKFFESDVIGGERNFLCGGSGRYVERSNEDQ
jgi:hypothetical protein